MGGLSCPGDRREQRGHSADTWVAAGGRGGWGRGKSAAAFLWAQRTRGATEETGAAISLSPLLLRPGIFSLPVPNIGAIHSPVTSAGSLPWKGPKPRTQLQLQMCRELCGGGEGTEPGSSLWQHPGMMQPGH